MAIETAISLKVFTEITGKQIVKYEVKNIAAGCVEVGYLIPFSFVGVNRGNVKISPGVQIDIYKGDKTTLIKSEKFTGEETLPTTEQTYHFNVSSENMTEGQYWANVSVFADGALTGSKFITLDIMKKGSLTKKGELINVRASEPWSEVGDVVRIDAVFKNTGQLTTNAKFKCEVYMEGILIKTLESDELEVPVGSTANLTVYYTPERTGRYEVNGVVYYSGKITYEKGTIINVLPKGAYQKLAPLKIEQFIFGVVVFVLLILCVWVLKRNSEDKEHTLKTVSSGFKSVESTLEKIIRNTKRMNKKVQTLKTRHSR